MVRKILFGILTVCVAGAAYLGWSRVRIEAPAPFVPGRLVRLEQGWTQEQAHRFHHEAQGTKLLRYEWFVALEQPCLSPGGCAPLVDPVYLSRFGFIPSPKDPEHNPDGLPVGFTLQRDFYDPETKQRYAVAGFTCAACHTGMVQYGGYDVLIEGAPAMIHITEFQKAMGVALLLTKWMPGRYGRFVDRVLGPNAPPEKRAALDAEFAQTLEMMARLTRVTQEKGTYSNVAGFARTDALTRIGNQVFAVDMNIDDNFWTSQAPVRYPQIWDAPWLNWVQYNSSIGDPLVRNIGQALGVRASLKLDGPEAKEYANSVRIEGLKWMEDQIAGPAPFQGLRSPKWPSVFPALDAAKAARGVVLYKQHCEACHLPPVEELAAKSEHWEPIEGGRRLLKVTDVPLDHIGTDPRQALEFVARTADTGALGLGRVSAAQGLTLVTGAIRDRFFNKNNFTREQRLEWSGYRSPYLQKVRDLRVYKARPLNGIWAVAPYLHNGSVSDLYSLLSPEGERPDTFWLGSKRFDPVRVGYESGRIEGGFEYDTRLVGNSNKGHQFADGPRGKGTIGPKLSPDERWALIEYLKSL